MTDKTSYLNLALQKIAKGAGIGFIGVFLGLTIGFFSRMVIARFLGASDYGLISLGVASMSIATTLSLIGLPTGIQRYVSFYKGKNDGGRIKGTIFGALKICFPLSLILTIFVFFGANWISLHVFHNVALTSILKIFSISIPFFVLAQIFFSVTIGCQVLKYQVYVNDLFQNIIKLVAIVSLLLLGFGVLSAACAWVFAIVLTPFMAFYFLEKRVFPLINSKVKTIPVQKELYSFSIPLIFSGFAMLVMGWTDTLMLGYFCTASEVGIYNVALPIARLLRVVVTAFAIIFLPIASELYAMGREEELRNIYSTVTRWVFSLILPGSLLMILFSKSIIEILFGLEFVDGARALSILVFGLLFGYTVGLNAQILQVYGKTKIIMLYTSISATANFVLNLFLIPLYGLNGAAIATASSFILGGFLRFIFVYRIGKMQPFRWNYLKPAFVSIIAVLVVYAVTKYVVGVSLPSLIIMLFVFLVLYFLLLLLVKGFEEEDLVIMKAIDERLGTKSNWIRGVIQRFL